MFYWRDSYFRDLQEAAAAASDQGWSQYAEYCTEHEKGLRAPAFAVLGKFIQTVQSAPVSERRRFVSWVLEFANERRGRDLLIPYPLKTRLVEPTLLEWVEAEPDNSAPHRWLGGRDHLERALELDPSDQIARKRLIILLLSGIEYATHELPRGYLGDLPDDLKVLDRVEALLPDLLDKHLRDSYAQAVSEEREAIAKYLGRRVPPFLT
jgi:hypothetical protein